MPATSHRRRSTAAELFDRRGDVETIARLVADALGHGDEQTRNGALVSFSEGIHPGTPLGDAVPGSPRDTWSGRSA